MSSDFEDRPETDPPLWSIGFAVAIMLAAPLLVYSISPAGPIRQGDTAFAEKSAKVTFANPLLYESARFDGTCLLDPEDPLMVVEPASDRPDGLVLVTVQGKTAFEWPFCPSQAEVLISLRQVMQKADPWSETKGRLSVWFR